VFLATVPDTGFQFVLAGTVATFEGDIHRGYMNGAGTSVSKGDTNGNGYAGAVRVGWAFMPSPGQVYLTPFAEYSIAQVEIDGWTETTGPFPAVISDINDTANKLRLGAEGRVIIGADSWMWGSLAWGHRFESNSATFTGDLIDLFTVSAPGVPLEQDWLEATAGIRLPVTAGSAMTASVTTQAFSDDVPLVQGRLGFSSFF
jgi:outer membrane autotransporter protein